MHHPLRFGIITLQDLSWPTLVEHWKHVESLGYDSVWVADHFVNPHHIEDNWFDGWTLLAALATQTSTVHIGTLVTNFIYRNPALPSNRCLNREMLERVATEAIPAIKAKSAS